MRNKILIAVAIAATLMALAAAAALPATRSPGDEEPTDRSIWVKIDRANFSMEEVDDKEKITIEVEGEASPGVDHCGIVFVTVYKNGSTDYGGIFIEGPLNITGKEPIIFLPINGSWQKWRFYNVVYVDKEKLGIEKGELKNISSFQIWVRAYKDRNGTLWNQTNATLTQVVKKEIETVFKEENGKKKLPGFSFIAIIAAIASICIWNRFK